MKRNWPVLIVVVIAVAIGVSSFLYTVDETEQVVITRFGKPIRSVSEAGLHVKMPFVDTVNTFPRQVLAWDGTPDQIPTSDKKYIFVDTFARWRIVDADRFFKSVRNEGGAVLRLNAIIDGATRDVISRNTLVEVVRNTNRELLEEDAGEGLGTDYEIAEVMIGREEIAQRIYEKAREKIESSFGIELLDVRVKRINYIQEVRVKVFERMISERKRIAELFRSEGQRNRQEIFGLRDKELKRIESEAYLTAQQLRGKADAEAARIYAQAFGQDAEFFQFTQALKTFRDTLGSDTTLLLSTDSDYLKYLKKSSPR
ncbi:MAG: protease modulator HflC [Acidobacteriota bacterium]